MNRHRASRFKRAIVELRFWLDEHRPLLVTLFLLAACTIALAMIATRDRDQPAIGEDAIVVRFGTTPDLEGDDPHVLVRMKDGSILHLDASRRELLYCRRGSRIRVVRQGGQVYVASAGCAPRAP